MSTEDRGVGICFLVWTAVPIAGDVVICYIARSMLEQSRVLRLSFSRVLGKYWCETGGVSVLQVTTGPDIHTFILYKKKEDGQMSLDLAEVGHVMLTKILRIPDFDMSAFSDRLPTAGMEIERVWLAGTNRRG